MVQVEEVVGGPGLLQGGDLLREAAGHRCHVHAKDAGDAGVHRVDRDGLGQHLVAPGEQRQLAEGVEAPQEHEVGPLAVEDRPDLLEDAGEHLSGLDRLRGEGGRLLGGQARDLGVGVGEPG